MTSEKLKLTIDPDKIEKGAWDQINRVLSLPQLEKLVILPDVHQGYDMPIGGVGLLDNYIWPGAVGYDQACGMTHVNTSLTTEDLKLTKKKQREKLYNDILKVVPIIVRDDELDYDKFPNASGDKYLKDQVEAKAGYQLGTTGQGNHFIELGINDKNQVGITIHSGSRKSGWLIADYWMNKVKRDGECYSGLWMYKLDSDLGQQFLQDLYWSQNYALMNRRIMIEEILRCMKLNPNDYDVINENHNFADIIDENKVRHRKGATPADKGQLGIIPSNQRDGVWITEGLGNEEFLSSASHGAGRVMSRTKAKKSIKLESFQDQMKGVISRTDKNVLDEAPDAYKNINEVLDAQDGLIVNVIDHFKPLIVIKG